MAAPTVPAVAPISNGTEEVTQIGPGVTLAPDSVPISKFKASYGRVLADVDKGRAGVITQGRKRYILLSEEQVIALARAGETQTGLGSVFATMPTPSAPRTPMQVHVSAPEAEQYSLPRGRRSAR